ncbi:hypothetical protein jhhlp_003005 [Lomentospora prolificans]|uniref:N-acetylglucosaminyl-phosphatidylinositol biosynthetic protein gpi1 n=1 Tax=Lomentospora prolificans TaxID=41688 RepID=A0A2N3NFM9_9PEZI|nr:hypothetical protein jhhlp_003005 [Lomentospora prolificans]
MHAFSIFAWAIFVAGYITARWDLVTRLYELAIFAWDHGTRAAKGFLILTLFFLVLALPVYFITEAEADLVLQAASLNPTRHRKGQTDKRAHCSTPEVQDSACLLGSNCDVVPKVKVTRAALAAMPGYDGLMRIFWPADIARSEFPGVIVGWRNSELDVFVVAVLDVADPQNVEYHLKIGTLLRNSSHPVNRVYELCGHLSMHVLGVTNAPESTSVDPSWVRATTGPNYPVPIIRCDRASNVQIVLFKRPQPLRMQYMSLNPIALDLEERYFDMPTSGIEAVNEQQEREKREEKQRLVEKLKQHSIIKRTLSPKEKTLPRVINQINWAWELEQLLQKNLHMVGPRPKRSLSVSERVVESANTVKDAAMSWFWCLFIVYIFPIIQRFFSLILLGHRITAELLLRVLEFRARPHHAALKDLSATAQQVEIRLQQFCYWPTQHMKLRQRKSDWASVTTSHPDYIRFFNSLWLVANDVIIGIAMGSYIIEHAEWVGQQIGIILRTYTVEALQTSITWLMGWPAGLKLNNELAAFLGDLFLWVIDYWSGFIDLLQPALPHIIWFIGFSSFGGASMPLAMFSDLLSALTIHIYSFYLASARIFNWQLSILISLFHLFRGKKHNVLRNRIDSCDYDLDQLLVGTIVFTLLVFLLPTVLVFYLNFAIARMIIISLKAAFDTLLSCLNHFPLFAIMLRIKDPSRLPGGVRFELGKSHPVVRSPTNSLNRPPTSVIHLKPVPLTFGSMFHQYLQMAQRIRKHYLSPTVLLCLVTGKFVPPIDRKNLYSLQYSMLPAKRPGIWEMWTALSSTSAPSKKPNWAGPGVRRHPFGGLPGRARGGAVHVK